MLTFTEFFLLKRVEVIFMVGFAYKVKGNLLKHSKIKFSYYILSRQYFTPQVSLPGATDKNVA